MTPPPIPESCLSCGACCVCPTDPKWIEVSLEDAENLHATMLQPGDRLTFAMRQDPKDGRCVALKGRPGQQVECTVYANRPSICREVQPSGAICQIMLTLHQHLTDKAAATKKPVK